MCTNSGLTHKATTPYTPAHDLTDKGVRAAFKANQTFDIQLYTEHMDFSRFEAHDEQFSYDGMDLKDGREHGMGFVQPTNGLRTLNPGNRPKSLSADHSSVTPCCWHRAATRASCTCGPDTRPV